MILVKPSYEVLTVIDGKGILERIESAGRTCYKSEEKISINTAEKFVAGILKRGHESVIEHENISVRIICDRGVTHEIVRHRLCAYSQESTRYCNYKGGVTFVIPPWVNLPEGEISDGTIETRTELLKAISWKDESTEGLWLKAMDWAECTYIKLLENNWSPQQARSVLPNSLKTEIVMTANIREWRHILRLRTSQAAHPQMRETMVPILTEFQAKIPILFNDIENKEK